MHAHQQHHYQHPATSFWRPVAAPPYPVRATYPYPAFGTTAVLTAGLLGTVIGSTGAMAVDLHKVQDGQMTKSQAPADSLAKGAGVGVATAAAIAVARAVGGGPLLSLAVMIATATGVGDVINHVGKSAAAKMSEGK